jgi:iron complex outermembrane receptor protein
MGMTSDIRNERRTPRHRRYGIALSAIVASLATTPVLAQDGTTPTSAAIEDAQSGDEILVTAQRRTESIQDVPIAITAITAQTLRDQNVQSVEDYFALTPNVSFQSNGSRDRKDLSIRGISNQLNPYADVRQGSYAFYIDEFNVAAATSNPQIVDLERIEVLRGPQGTYFGRNSVGGAINIITKKPVNEFEGEVELGYSSFDTKRVQGVLNVPVIDGVLALRASGQYEESDGYIKNINAIGGGNDSKFYNGRLQARFTPIDDLTWDFAYSYSDEATGMRNGVPTGFVTATWASVYYGRPAGQIGNPDGVGFYPDNTNRVNFNRPQKVGSKYQYYSTRAVWDLGLASVTAVLGHLKSDVFNYGDVDGGSRDFFYENLKLTRKSTSGELRLQSNGTNFLDWSLGASVGRDTGETDQATLHGRDSPLCPANRVNDCEGLAVTGLISDSSTKYMAIFAQGTFNLSNQFAATIGGRYSYEKTRNFAENRSNDILTAVNDRSAAFEDFSPKFTLSYKADRDLLFFATASRGFKSGGTQTSNNVNLANDFQPETLWNYELGSKFELFDRRLRVDLTGFYMEGRAADHPLPVYRYRHRPAARRERHCQRGGGGQLRDRGQLRSSRDRRVQAERQCRLQQVQVQGLSERPDRRRGDRHHRPPAGQRTEVHARCTGAVQAPDHRHDRRLRPWRMELSLGNALLAARLSLYRVSVRLAELSQREPARRDRERSHPRYGVRREPVQSGLFRQRL